MSKPRLTRSTTNRINGACRHIEGAIFTQMKRVNNPVTVQRRPPHMYGEDRSVEVSTERIDFHV